LRIGAATLKVSTRLADVDNAREALDETGKITGPEPSKTLTSRIDQGLDKLSHTMSGLAGILGAVKEGVVKEADPDIDYEPGVEMTLKLTKALTLKAPSTDPHVAALRPFPNEQGLSALVNRQPFQTYAQNPPRKSDVTNLMFAGSREELEAAFTEAGWSGAEKLGRKSKLEAAIAIVEQRGYKEAPVSVLILDDRPPDIVFQKGNNTFAARHHLRIWRSPDNFNGQPVWICSSTHDTGIDFSQQEMTFIHKIDPNIDAERAKIVNDLLFTGKVRSLALVERPKVPQHARNATGDNLDTDGRMAVLLLQ
jgi:hypothetical protein